MLKKLKCLLLALYLVASLTGSVHAEATKPPGTGELYNYEGTLNLSELKPDTGVTTGITDINGTKLIKVDFPALKGYPGLSFPVPADGWDLTGYKGVQIVLHNPMSDPVPVNLRVDNPGESKESPWNTEIVTLQPGETKTLKVVFGHSFNSPGYKLNPARVSSIRVFLQGLTKPTSIAIGKPVAFKGGAEPAAAASTKPPVSQKYLTTTVSPKDHTVPYGQSWELVKDWTFGTTRPDATIRNKKELDEEFYYRYIYDSGKLDILPTYWSYHRDYEDGDPRSLHVFGEDNLTLKGRIPPNGGLKLRGIETGMLRAKTPFVPGMYVEMRCKVTKGVGAWPSFWLNPGVQYKDGTFSKLGWPPEIDIFEFYGFRNRVEARTFSSNIQTNKKPEKYGPPYEIFSVFQKSDYTPGMDFAAEYHVFALDWHENRPIWLLDGHPIKQVYYEWPAPPAHILVVNALGIEFAKADMKEMTADESNWDFVIDYIRVYKHPGVVVPSTEPPPKPVAPASAAPAPAPTAPASAPAAAESK